MLYWRCTARSTWSAKSEENLDQPYGTDESLVPRAPLDVVAESWLQHAKWEKSYLWQLWSNSEVPNSRETQRRYCTTQFKNAELWQCMITAMGRT